MDQAAKGREFVIPKPGKPKVRVGAARSRTQRQDAGLSGRAGVLEVDVKEAFATDIEAMFGTGR